MPTTDAQKQVIFIQNAIPPLRDGPYLLNATQTIAGQDPGTFVAKSTFIVQGERFTIRPTEIDSAFPPNLANGEFDGVLPHVVFTRRTLPWERTLDTPGSRNTYKNSPWLAILVCDDATAPKLQAVTAKDLLPAGTPITVIESAVTGTGTLAKTTLSYGAALLGQLGYGETPDDACNVIDLPIATFNQIAPAADDLEYLAHIREVDTTDGLDSDQATVQYAVVVANRIGAQTGVVRAFLVSLEGMADYLPALDGTQSAAIGALNAKLDHPIDTVRLIVYQSWTYTTNAMDQTLQRLLANLNKPGADGVRVTTLTLPIAGPAPAPDRVAQAMANQAKGKLADGDAAALMQNALLMGYVPVDHHLRRGGHTVSLYRGPLAPFAVPDAGAAYYSGPDAANAYNPQTGMFDVSYGAAWQLGQLLALKSSGMANELYQWKRAVTLKQAAAAEVALLEQRLKGAQVFPAFFAGRAEAANAAPPQPPPDVVAWFGNLVMLQGVPFNYLVPDERMLPPESIRFFHLDRNWIDALVDGAFSIGRAAVSDQSLEGRHAPAMRRLARAHRGRRAANRRLTAAVDADGAVTGFLIRSQAVAGWPNLRIVAFSNADPDPAAKIDAHRVAQLANDTLLCLFNGVVASLYLREPPEQLHHGVEGEPGRFYTTLRSVAGGPGPIPAGQQYTAGPTVRKTVCDPDGTNAWTCIPMRADGRTVIASTAASDIKKRLTDDFGQALPQGFTSAEFALELTKGVVEAEYRR